MKRINEYFDDEAAVHDELAQKWGLGEFYDKVDQELNQCISKDRILVLGCGSGLEVERIKYPAEVVGIDISEKMLGVLNQKTLYPGLHLTTVCASFLDIDLEEEQYDIVISCYVMHHFNIKQKHDIYEKIYRCLKKDGVFMNGDLMVPDMDKEEYYRKNAEEIYEKENLPYGSLHLDTPFCWIHEKEVLAASGFIEISLVKEWTETKLYKCIK
jgi:tRNA (cmo5U34)-methyltransferase